MPKRAKIAWVTKDEVLRVMAAQREAEERWRYDSGIYEISELEDRLEKGPWHEEYPRNWEQLRRHIFQRAKGQCECCGECGLEWEHGRWGDGRIGRRRCPNQRGKRAVGRRRKAVLCLAHLCRVKRCANESHLKAMCRACHWFFDHPRDRFLKPVQLRGKCLL